MAGRQHAAIRLDMWSDDDWRARTIQAQWLYLFLMTTETLNYTGVADWRAARIAGHATDLDQAKVLVAAAELEQHHFIVTDHESEEVLIRSFLRHDGLLNKPNVTKAMVKAFKMVVSPRIRGVIVHELGRLADEFPEWSAWGSDEVQIILTKPSINAKERVSEQIAKGSTKGSESDASLLTPYSLLPSPNTQLQEPLSADLSADPGSLIPDGWKYTQKHRDMAISLRLDVDRELARFAHHATTKQRRMKNWNAGFTNWLKQGAVMSQQRTVTPPAAKFDTRNPTGKKIAPQDQWMYDR